MKTCTKCKITKSFESFGKHSLSKDGYRCHCKECMKEYRTLNIERITIRNKQWYEKNIEIIKEQRNKYLSDNSEKIKLSKSNYRKNNREKVLKYKRELYQKQKQDPLFIAKKRARRAIGRGFIVNGFKKNFLTHQILGCDYEFFKSYIESQFTKDMCWENIHIDHIKPLSSANTIEEVYQISHYTNFQPLLIKDNLTKSNKIIEKQLRLL